MLKTQISEHVFIIEDFLSSKECIDFISEGEDTGFTEATVTTREGQKMIKGVRNNTRVISTDFELSTSIWNKIKPFVNSLLDGSEPIGINEQFRYYKYDKGERFNKHIDGRFRRNNKEESRLTLMIYLNDNFTGGYTEFDDFEIEPKAGTALIFKHELRHKGCVIDSGTKYALRTDIMFSVG